MREEKNRLLRSDLDGKFGMSEMEDAALVILKLIVPRKNVAKRIILEHFNTNSERIGFLHLLNYGWLKRSTYNGTFRVTSAFLHQVGWWK